MEPFTLVIGNKNYSSWSMRPWLAMKQFKIPFEEIVIPLFEGDFKQNILQYSPSGKVPLLKHGRLQVWDSLAICEYLFEIFPEKQMWPKDPPKRARARSISAEMHSSFMALRTNCTMDVRTLNKKPKANPPELQKDIDRIINIWEECRRNAKKEGDFLFGAFSIADAMYAPVVFRFRSYGPELKGAAKDYSEAILNLPTVQEWIAAVVKEPWTIHH